MQDLFKRNIKFFFGSAGSFRSVQYGTEFPATLYGIITPEEFNQSIVNINLAHRTTVWEKVLLAIGPLCFLVGAIILILLAIPSVRENALIPIAVVGGVVAIVAILLANAIRVCIVNPRRAIRVRNILANESMRCTRNFKIPFTWRFEQTYVPDDDIVEYSYYRQDVSSFNLNIQIFTKKCSELD